MTGGRNSLALPIVSAANGVSVLGRPRFHLRYSAALSWLQLFLIHLAEKVLNSSGWNPVGPTAKGNISTPARDDILLDL